MRMTHIEKAEKLFKEKYHCSQAVLGACTGALMALGLKYGKWCLLR